MSGTVGPQNASCVVVCGPDKLVECFEGLGDLCEFGNVQSFCGAEPLGLLRFASMPMDELLRLLSGRFEALGDPDAIDVFTMPPDPEWWGGIPAFGIRYHAAADSRRISKAAILARERKRVAFLVRRLLEDLVSGDKIFLRRDPGQEPAAIAALGRALRDYGANDLLWVDQAGDDGQIGHAALAAGNLVRGYLGHFWPDAAPSPGGLGIWLSVLDRALAALRPGRWAALQAAASYRCPSDKVLPGLGWHCTRAAEVRQMDDVPAFDVTRPVLQHRATRDISLQDALIVACEGARFQQDALYVASCWVWLPDGFEGWLGMMFAGQRPVRLWPADTGVRECWQCVATSFRCSASGDISPPGLAAVVKAGMTFYSTCWRVERGVVPEDCLKQAG